MKCITIDYEKAANEGVWQEAEKKYDIIIRKDIKEFLKLNSAGYPVRSFIVSDGDEYEVRVFLSLDKDNQYYYIGRPLDFFLSKTKGKMIPIGIDSGDNYYCVNNDTGKVYYWSAGEDLYYCVAQSFDNFISLFER